MKGFCSKCDKKDDCVKLCSEAEKYVNQDYGSQNEYLGKYPVWDNIKNVIDWEGVNLENPSILKLVIVRLWKDGKSKKDIARYVPCGRRYIREIIQKWKEGGSKLKDK